MRTDHMSLIRSFTSVRVSIPLVNMDSIIGISNHDAPGGALSSLPAEIVHRGIPNPFDVSYGNE